MELNKSIEAGVKYLIENDRVMRALIDKNGNCTLSPSQDYFNDLVYSIISQQLSAKAANSIYNKLQKIVPVILPESIQKVEGDTLKTAGLSSRKIKFIKGLADYFCNNAGLIKNFHNQSDNEIISELCKVNGIGVWTAQMFLIFSLNRLDVLPLDDVGFRRSFRHNYNLKDSNQIEEHIIRASIKWGRYKSLAAWYLWHDLDNS